FAQATRADSAGSWRLRADAVALVGPADVPMQWLARAGGPVSGPGYDFHEFVGRSMISTRAEFRRRIPFPVIPLGRFGRTGGEASLLPFGHAVWVQGAPSEANGVFPSAGLGLGLFSDLLRVDIARGLRGGRWRFAIDLTTEFWPIL
ncbi:MAG: hypothetical protein K2X99_06460, partial [Gemmatimonadaceae bacterium]|nr:hypothetical protein [Gemmatimonadaceae bacterium]